MSSRDQAREVLKRLPVGPLCGAEVGVFAGKMSRELLTRPDLELYMVDNWLPMPKYGIDEARQAENRTKARLVAAQSGRGIVLAMDSALAAQCVPDKSLSFVFIDADHSYSGVTNDIRAWMPKLKAGGLMSGHDYGNPSEPCGEEVKRAVDEMAVIYGKTVERGEDSTWFYR